MRPNLSSNTSPPRSPPSVRRSSSAVAVRFPSHSSVPVGGGDPGRGARDAGGGHGRRARDAGHALSAQRARARCCRFGFGHRDAGCRGRPCTGRCCRYYGRGAEAACAKGANAQASCGAGTCSASK